MTHPTLIDQLNLTDRGVISLIGAGGKTSLMFRLAKELADSNKRVLTTTTTKIFMPNSDNSPETIFAESMDALLGQIKDRLQHYSHFSAGSRYDSNLRKVIGLPPEMIDQLWHADLFDWIIVEADGAKRKPLKATGPHEPVIPSLTGHVILVAGLDAVGLPLNDDHVHRAQVFSRNTRRPLQSIIDEQAIATAVAIEIHKAKSSVQTVKTVVVLNKADTPEMIASGHRIERILARQTAIDKVIVTSLLKQASVET